MRMAASAFGCLLLQPGLVRDAHAQATVGTCRAADSLSAIQVHRTRVRATSTDAASVQTRDSVLKVPALSSGDVQLVTTSTVCQQASRSLDAYLVSLGKPTRARSVIVITLGSAAYVVIDPDERFGEWQTAVVLDSAYARKSPGLFGM